jgi:hypothetical protein
MCDLSKTKQIVPLGKPVLTITLIVNFQGEKRVWHGAWSMEHGAWGNNFELRIVKLGTRPQGGSPKDNCEFEEA